MPTFRVFSALLLLMAVAVEPTQAQYFGRNKPHYTEQHFSVCQTPHFDLYYDTQNPEEISRIAAEAEDWYLLHQMIFRDTFRERNPLIVYNDHADFQQTNAISGDIEVGTGGVTEGLKNRVIFPIAMSNQQTSHVLGHELVHAFQYHLLLHTDSVSLRNMGNLPLWMVEGLAEYLSIGRTDPFTAMWMRDAIINRYFPTLNDLNNYGKYFPYRWGQAFWAYVTGVYGDDIIQPLFAQTARYGLDIALKNVLKTDDKKLSADWKAAFETYYAQYLTGSKEKAPGKLLIDDEKAGRLNISPSISPNGKYVIFLTEKNLFTVDYYLADARTGKIIRKIASESRDGRLDAFNWVESAGTWSPDSKFFAFVAYEKGRNVLVVKEAASGRTSKVIAIPGVPAFNNPAWAPRGQEIVVAGLVNGQVDLYGFDIKTMKVRRLTNDAYSEMLPAWSADGSRLVFSSDRLSFGKGRVNGKWVYNLSELDLATGNVSDIRIFWGADNLNPAYDNHGNILFVSDRDGYRNLYRYEPDSGKVFQLTRLSTGITGITGYAPAFSVARDRDRVLYSRYFNREYSIYEAAASDFINEEIPANSVNFSAGVIPPLEGGKRDLVNIGLSRIDHLPDLPDSAFANKPYQARFKLDYVGGNAGVGVGVGNLGTATGLAGGVDMLFSDMLGDHQLYAGLALNGEIYDMAGQIGYFNQKKRFGWGVSLSHIPYRSGLLGYAGVDTLRTDQGEAIPADHYILEYDRIFEDRLDVFGQYPLSKIIRVEGGAGFSYYYYRIDQYHSYYDQNYGILVYQSHNKTDAPPGFQLLNANAAIVGDNAYFGIASPMQGYRYRLGLEKYFGTYDFYSLTADYRIYQYAKPVSFAFRLMHLGRYGSDATRIPQIYIGNPWFVRGYDYSTLSRIFNNNDNDINRLVGSKVLVSNFEIRLPFSGPERLALIRSDYFFTELALFADGGVAWNALNDFKEKGGNSNALKPLPVFSAGASLRINLFGAMVLEPYYAFPIIRGSQGVFGLNIIPGW